jgi:hypothetical protein
MRDCAFFSPSLDPVLDGGKGGKDAVVAPEGPTRGPVGQAILDHEPHRQIHHAMGVLTARWGEIGEVGVKVPDNHIEGSSSERYSWVADAM